MNAKISFNPIDWTTVSKTVESGQPGQSISRTVAFEGLRIRMVEYQAGYVADHWCTKGHIVHCIEGEFVNEMQNGETLRMTAGMTYVVSDNMTIHRSVSPQGAKILIIDGQFLS